jgi:alpha-mannosidase
MALTPEWKKRLANWTRTLSEQLYQPLENVELEGFFTTEQLTPDQAQQRDVAPIATGTPWGTPWQHAWFRATLVTPKLADGKPVAFRLPVTPYEAAIYIDGQQQASLRSSGWVIRQYQELSAAGNAGETFELLAEATGYFDKTTCRPGPMSPDRAKPNSGAPQATVGQATIGTFCEEAYQLLIDVHTLTCLRNALGSDSLRVAKIDEGLRDFTVIVDFEQPAEQRLASYTQARARLAPLLECTNGSTAPDFYCFGHAHLDIAWLWPTAETERKVARTLANQLALAARYPEHKFLHSQPHLFRMLKQNDPKLYARVKQAVADGQIIAEGGMWVEADTNISSGESLIRQFLHGKKFFRDEFGVDSRLMWLPDVFGYTGALPQIMKGCGIDYFSTHKIFWNYNGGETFPYHNFLWEGIDGSEIVVHLHQDYNHPTDPGSLIHRWNTRVQADDMSMRMIPFGHGDGGGGPTRDHLEYLQRETDLEGVPRCTIAGPVEFFEELVARGEHDKHRYVGELYFQAHRGVLTSQAKTKQGNRKCEVALREAEMWSVAAATMGDGFSYPVAQMDEAWKGVLLNQFHDILPGSSIARVYAEAEALYDDVQATAQSVVESALDAVVEPADALIVANSMGWDRRVLVELPDDWNGATDLEQECLCVQQTPDARYVEVPLPACGWTTITKGMGPRPSCTGGDARARAGEQWLENDQLRVEFNSRGEMVRAFDKIAGRELLSGVSNQMQLWKDVPVNYDAWDIDMTYEQSPVALPEEAEIEIVAVGPLVARLRIRRKINDSTMEQIVSLRRGARRVDFETRIDWQETHKLLKVGFEPALHANEAIHEIQHGTIARPTHRSRPFDTDRFEVCNHRWTAITEADKGFAVLNDCKYGVNVLGSRIQLSLLRASKGPDEFADRGAQTFTYAFTAWNGPYASADVIQQGWDLNTPAQIVAGAAGETCLLRTSADHVVIDTVKPAEDGSGDVIVRLVEAKGMSTDCTLAIGFDAASAAEIDMLETETLAPLEMQDGQVQLHFRAFEVKTVRVK